MSFRHEEPGPGEAVAKGQTFWVDSCPLKVLECSLQCQGAGRLGNRDFVDDPSKVGP